MRKAIYEEDDSFKGKAEMLKEMPLPGTGGEIELLSPIPK